MKVLSCFDGISCGRLALQQLGITPTHYFASEIDKNAIKVATDNYADTIQLGDIDNWETWKLPWGEIDLLQGGFPCQAFSMSGKQLGFKDERGKLFFTLMEILTHIQTLNPNVKFLFENVVMKSEFKTAISEKIGADPIQINSSLVSAQNRERLYWTNIKGVEQPQDKGIILDHIIVPEENAVFDDYYIKLNPAAVRGRRLQKATIIGRRLNEQGKRENYNKEIPITQCLEVRATNTDKSNCLTTVAKDNVLTPLPVGRYPNAFKDKLPFRYYSSVECHRLQTLPDDWCKAISRSASTKAIGNGWTVSVIEHILKNIYN